MLKHLSTGAFCTLYVQVFTTAPLRLCLTYGQLPKMLSSAKTSLARMELSATSKAIVARPMAPSVVRRVAPPRPVAARALLLPQQDSKQSDPLDAIISVVLSWLEPKQDSHSSTEETILDLGMHDDDEGHTGWGHSHIADRLATASSMSQEFDV